MSSDRLTIAELRELERNFHGARRTQLVQIEADELSKLIATARLSVSCYCNPPASDEIERLTRERDQAEALYVDQQEATRAIISASAPASAMGAACTCYWPNGPALPIGQATCPVHAPPAQSVPVSESDAELKAWIAEAVRDGLLSLTPTSDKPYTQDAQERITPLESLKERLAGHLYDWGETIPEIERIYLREALARIEGLEAELQNLRHEWKPPSALWELEAENKRLEQHEQTLHDNGIESHSEAIATITILKAKLERACNALVTISRRSDDEQICQYARFVLSEVKGNE